MGSIPARAGEPTWRLASTSTNLAKVYPRACGGTAIALNVHQPRIGVYPRACGGTVSNKAEPVYPRACGGTRAERFAVYPRACGGTGWVKRLLVPMMRSIPARAGEPYTVTVTSCRNLPGLSPRVRGNRDMPTVRASYPVGSIPARAGEPEGDCTRSDLA